MSRLKGMYSDKTRVRQQSLSHQRLGLDFFSFNLRFNCWLMSWIISLSETMSCWIIMFWAELHTLFITFYMTYLIGLKNEMSHQCQGWLLLNVPWISGYFCDNHFNLESLALTCLSIIQNPSAYHYWLAYDWLIAN